MKNYLNKLKKLHAQKVTIEAIIEAENAKRNAVRRKADNAFKKKTKDLKEELVSIEVQVKKILEA